MINIKSAIALTIACLCTPLSQAATCQANSPINTPDDRFQTDTNGTVLDLQTGLMWDRCALGQTWDNALKLCTGTASTKNWRQATRSGMDHSLGGYTDWRLPNIKELQTIIELSCWRPAINVTIFPDDGFLQIHNYWSSTPHVVYTQQAWMVNLDAGYNFDNLMDKNSQHEVRLVRGGN
ncbi:DUF1566 domain-containing protein [Agarivorans aestuarii]|uniref:DUF1566 domain-containing protein n=1 Tax=Agarivorans aestuarii TaxID=1563703 RepID=A0ABU7G3D7_9ALTE|nr:DUF1566 domain-containing protein [Agarivorans aestuarii]MEE1673904.1 DUF1566 domain-containing protein [Agarivorans aestuarii]